jgi:tyrosyl-tRNA synthetase
MSNVFDTLKARGYIKRTSDDEAVRELLGRPPVTIYQGFDPTAPSLHIGHFLGLMAFRYLQEAGHRMIFLVGGGTGIVGDPIGQSQSRRKMTREDIQSNAESLRRQVQRIGLVDFEGGHPPALLLNNADWLDMPLFHYLESVAPHFSVNVMVKQDTFARRLAEQKSLTLFEFMYPTLQGFDFLHQFDHYGCRIQIGGDDQWGNLVAGLDLIQNVRHQRAQVFTLPLLLDTAGQKIGKTTGGKAVWLDAEATSPFEFYQYWINMPDSEQDTYYRLLTFLPLDEIAQILAGDRREAARRLAFEITRIVHGAAATAGVQLIDLLVRAGVRSKSEARRLIEGGGVQVNGARVQNLQQALGLADLQEVGGQRTALIRFGKGKVIKVQLA